MLTLTREHLTPEEWDTLDSVCDTHFAPGEYSRPFLENVVFWGKRRLKVQANEGWHSARETRALQMALQKLEDLITTKQLITRKNVKPEDARKRTGKGKKAA